MSDAVQQLGLVDDEAIELDAAALQLAALDHPQVALEPYVARLAAIAEELAAAGDIVSGSGQAAALARVLAEANGFAGDRDTYDHPDNADLIRVIDRRRGLPVSLTILYVAAARRVGWRADPLNTPGHVLASIGPAAAPVLIDPFNGGRIVEQAQLAALLSRMRGAATEPTAADLAPMANRAVLARLLMNQATRAEAIGDATRALTVVQRITGISPGTGSAWWQRARLELQQGEVSAARASLSAMLEVTRDAPTRAKISATLDALASRAR